MDRPGRVLFRRSLSLHVGCLRRGPVVQIVGDAVALPAFPELRHDARGMGRTVAVLALGHHLVLFLVAERA